MKIPLPRRAVAAAGVVAVATAVVVSMSSPSQASLRPQWVGTWSTALTTPSIFGTGGSIAGFTNESVRMIVRTSVEGDRLRIHLANTFGTGPVTIGHASVAFTSAPASPDLNPSSIHELTFQGSSSVIMYKGADVLSDPVSMHVPALSELAVTLFMPVATGQTSWHQFAGERSYVYAGDRAADPSGSGPEITRTSFYFLAGIDVASPHADSSVVVVGDSISDGAGNTFNANHRWPDFLAARITGGPPGHEIGVLNESLSGNQITHDGLEISAGGFGASALARLDADVFGQTQVEAVIVELGVNDLNTSVDPADRIIGGLKQLAAQLRENGVEALVCTVGPFEGYVDVGLGGWTPEKEMVRAAVNDYIRHQHDFDAVVDMDQALRDPANPTKLLPAFDSGDHIHPNDAGAQALANAVPLPEL